MRAPGRIGMKTCCEGGRKGGREGEDGVECRERWNECRVRVGMSVE